MKTDEEEDTQEKIEFKISEQTQPKITLDLA